MNADRSSWEVTCAYCFKPFSKRDWAPYVRGGVCSVTCANRSGRGVFLEWDPNHKPKGKRNN